MEILGKFYLSNGQTIEEKVHYKKVNEKVTDEEFRKEVEKIRDETEKFLSEEIFSRSTKVFPFGNSVIKIEAIVAFHFIVVEEAEEEIVYDIADM